ncbi:hypothetical protein ASPBRDRAFT_285748 [Aspergillus brasiliensis CBS 101740]|uniref:Heterokaryon incompatibility domain-containing protein n=1 Tax=Aspergillus brasiliensis (strain CBS 101740 / IMI 381727 / IBT 21946) TaxID=767769 RepID=A0A1L9UDI5_ASPBC|nr:hypothetical protein ASPBRDRAFT_285748 [Aspergillus brasiliensis CBS 101740]
MDLSRKRRCYGCRWTYKALTSRRTMTSWHACGVSTVREILERYSMRFYGMARGLKWKIISGWFEDCRSNHGGYCYRGPLNTPPAGFSVIDCQRGCVVKAPSSCHYATLSYVWGRQDTGDLQARKDNIEVLEKEGCLFTSQVPLTIRDAMVVCTKLNIPYLWVDRLCIVQDENESKSVQINAMGDIYGHSVVTICALAGEDANYGLPGVSENRDIVPWYGHCQGVHLISYHSTPWTLIDRSKWNSRGWTFQEAILSSRLLLFSDEGVFFECSSRVGRLLDEDRKIRSTSYEEPNRFLGNSITQGYMSKLEAFTQRDLTFESDILRAFSGVLQGVWGSEHYYGIPYPLFGARLLWQSMDGKYRRRTPNAGDMFPS